MAKEEELKMETDCERNRRERNEKICRDYQEMWARAEYLGMKRRRVLLVLAKRNNMSDMQVKNILRQNGLY